MNLLYLSWTWPLFFGGVVSLALAYLGWRRIGAPGVHGFIFLMLALVLWSIPDGLLLISDDPFYRLLWTKVEYFGIVMVPMAWWATAMGYVGQGRALTRRRLAYLSIIPFITLVLVWSLESHTLIYRDYFFYRDRDILHLNLTYGPWWWINAAYSYVFLLWGAALFLMAASRSFFVYRAQALALLIGISLPILGNLLYIFRIGPAGDLDLTPFTFAMAGLPLGWAIFRLRLFDLAPIARHAVMEGMRDGVVILDPMNRISDLNPAAEEILGQAGKFLVGRSVTETLGVWLGVPGEILREESARQDLHLRVGGEDRTFELNISSLSFREGELAGRLLILQDVTEWRALGSELNTAKEEIQRLAGFLPMCAWCKQVRNDEGYWEGLESYLTQTTQTEITHGICPTCKAALEEGEERSTPPL
jgi:PAS domain S-box-containing protein